MTSSRVLGQACILAVCVTMFAPGARGQSVSVEAGNLRGSATAGAGAHVGTPHDADANCRSVTVRSGGNSSASASASSSSGGQTVVAGSGSPGSQIVTRDCGERHAASPSRRNRND